MSGGHRRRPDLRGPGLLRPGLRGEARRPPGRAGRGPRHPLGHLQGQRRARSTASRSTINNWDAETRAFKYSDQHLFDPGKQLELCMGYQGGRLRLMLTGEITSLRPVVPRRRQLDAGGQRAQRPAPLPHASRSRRTYVEQDRQPDRRADRRRASRSRSRPTRPRPTSRASTTCIQDNQYDIIFLMERARRVGYDLFVEERADGQLARDGARLRPVARPCAARPTGSPTASR